MEQVFVVRRQDFFGGNWPQGFVPIADMDRGNLCESLQSNGFFANRAVAELEPQWKQVIPYCVIRRPGEVFCVQRKHAQTESRLHGMLSIGIGGHVNPDPDGPAGSGLEMFSRALQKELVEELVLEWREDRKPQFLGILNDDSTPVGQVHMGLVYQLEIAAPRQHPATSEFLRVREISKMTGGFRSLVELAPLWQDPGRFESWSRILLTAGMAGPKAPSNEIRRLAQSTENGREERTHG